MVDLFRYVLLASFWSTCLIGLLFFFNKVSKSKLPLSWHYYIWVVVLIRLLLPVFITVHVVSDTVHPDFLIFQADSPTKQLYSTEKIEHKEIQPLSPVQHKEQIQPSAAIDTPDGYTFPVFALSILWIIWLIPAICIILYQALSYFYYIQKLKASYILPSEEEMFLLILQKKRLNIKRKVTLQKSRYVQSPFAIGLFHVCIVLPDITYSNVQLNYIMQHELIHIKRHDILIKWLFELSKAIHWFNPFIHIAAQSASFYCEASCDAIVLKNSTYEERKEYGMIMLDLIQKMIHPKISLCVSMHSKKATLKHRIHLILNNKPSKIRIPLVLTITAITIALSACSGIRLQEIPQDTVDTPTKAKTNILIAGMDNGGDISRADTIIIASFDAIHNQITLLSIPRDTYIMPSEKTVSALSAQGIALPSEMKLGQIPTYPLNNKMSYLENEISNALDIPIDYYIKLELPAFQKIIDSIGGVDMSIPEGGLYYSDPTQNLTIDLKGGAQHLTGEQTLMLAQYRSYPRGDLDRMVVQQQLLTKLYTKILSTENPIETASTLFSILLKNTETNLAPKAIAPYLSHIPDMKETSLQAFLLPVRSEQKEERIYSIIEQEVFENTYADIFRGSGK